MKMLYEAYRNARAIHHAYVIEGDRAAAVSELLGFLSSELGVSPRGNPDFWHRQFESFGIDEARELRDAQLRRALDGGRKIFIIETDAITVEAQNALLKVFEEPTDGTHIFLVMPSSSALLPTLLSRVQYAHYDGPATVGKEAESFLSASAAIRADMIKSFIDEKDKSGAISFLSSLELELRKRINLVWANEEEIFALEQVGRAISYMRDRSPSVKQLLEHVSAVIPRY